MSNELKPYEYYMHKQSSKETGNWAYVIRRVKDNQRVLTTGDWSFAMSELNTLNGKSEEPTD